jgi:P-type Cu2+ transporter
MGDLEHLPDAPGHALEPEIGHAPFGNDVSHVGAGRATYTKMVQNLAWATGYNAVAIPLAAGVLYSYGIILTPALGAAFMSLSTVIVAINARLLRLKK